MLSRLLAATALFGALVLIDAKPAHAQQAPGVAQNTSNNRFYYYPYYYFPHNYWPSMSPKWPEGPGQSYMRPPAYMAYPPFKAPNWRYEWYEGQRYHRGGHFFLDQF
jgi:hypothetical protein